MSSELQVKNDAVVNVENYISINNYLKIIK